MAIIAWRHEAAGSARGVLVLTLRSVVRSGGALLGLFGIALLWAGVLYSLSAERKQALEGAVQDASNLSRAFEEHIVRSIKAVDQTLLYMRASYEKDPAGFDISAWTQNTQALTDLTFQISLIDRSGIMRASNLAPTGNRIDLSDREHFRVHRNSPRDELFISKPVLGRASHKWSIQMTRKMMTADGSFDGVIVVSLDPQYLSRFYDSVDLGKQGVVLLAGIDGTVRAGAGTAAPASARTGGADTMIGQSLADGGLLAEYARKRSGTFESSSELDGVKRVYAYRAVRGYPLIVSVGIAEGEVLAAHQANQRFYAALASVLSALLFSVTALVVVRQSRLDYAREQLRASEASHAQKSKLLETTLEHMSQGIFMVDAARRVQVCNRRTVEKLGLPASLMASQPHFDDVLRWQWEQEEFGKDGDAIEAGLRSFVLAGGLSDQPQTYERTRPNGTVLEIRSVPLPGGGAVRTYTDITLRKQNEAVLRAARDEADQAARAKSEFLATMSHEIRSPMSGLVGVLELLRETDLDPDQGGMASMAHSSALALLAVLNDILDFSKINAGALTIALEPTRLRDLVADLVQPHVFLASRKGIDLKARFSPEVPDCAETDPLRLRQILNNLLSNAIKFTPGGEIELSVDVSLDEPAPRLRFAVRDTGIGMAGHVIARLFEPFMQADSSITRDFGGTGLGLCISQQLTQLLDGALAVTSRVGGGSVFTLLLPLMVARLPDAARIAAAPQRPKSLPGRVLVVDDDPTNRWLSQRQLELLGLGVDAAENGQAAMELLRAGQYSLLLTDCHMPGMDGVALARAVRAAPDPALRALPIIGLTADVTSAQRERCLDAGMTDVAVKPLSRALLSRLLLRHLPETCAGEPPAPALPAPASPDLGSAEPAPFDDAIYHDLFSPGDPAGAAWLAEYLETAQHMDDELSQLLAVPGDPAIPRAAIAATAHRLAGSSLSVGAARCGEAARALEQASPAADGAALRRLHASVRDELAAVKAAIPAFLAEIQ